MRFKPWMAASLLTLFAGVASGADKAGEAWDGLVEVKSKRLDLAFLAPGADFRPYNKLMVDPTQAAFHKDWMENQNDRRDISRKIDEEHAQEILEAARTNFSEVFNEAFAKGGYTIVDQPGPDVLRVTPGVLNLYVNAPDVMSAGRSRTFTANAGEATMVLELRDSRSNALLGRVVDQRQTHDSLGMQMSNSVTNKTDFRMLFKSWATACVKGLETLKSVSPLPDTLKKGQKVD